MMIAIELAGYSWLEADKLRKAMGKKIPEVMAEQKEKLMLGFVEHGLSKENADQLWHLIEPFAAYGFNKAHAASYGRVAYQTSYMKANYPAEYMCAVLSAEAGDTDKVAEVITECERMKIPVLPPDVNESRGDFTVMKESAEGGGDSIRFGLHSIKNLGHDIADAIIEERDTGGAYESFANFLERVHHKNLTRRSLESLAKCGALDGIGDRADIIGNIEAALGYNRQVATERSTDQSSLFGGFEDMVNLPTFTLKPAPPISADIRLSWERELLGLYVSGHPLDRFREKVLKYGSSSARIKNEMKEGMTVVAAGLIEEVKEIMTKKGDKMAFVRLADFDGKVEVTVFPRTFAEHRHNLVVEQCVAIKGKISIRNGEAGVIADSIKILEAEKSSS
jgi:DNA polymerase-3 subunit alpha